MIFNEAAILLYQGKRVKLNKWNSESYIYLEKGKIIPNKVLREPQKTWFPEGMTIIDHLNYVSAKGDVIVGFIPYLHEIMNGVWEEYMGD